MVEFFSFFYSMHLEDCFKTFTKKRSFFDFFRRQTIFSTFTKFIFNVEFCIIFDWAILSFCVFIFTVLVLHSLILCSIANALLPLAEVVNISTFFDCSNPLFSPVEIQYQPVTLFFSLFFYFLPHRKTTSSFAIFAFEISSNRCKL